jgi:hypothetical protein
MNNLVELSPSSIEAIALRTAEIIRNAPPVDTDPLLDRKQAAEYLTFTVRTFDRERVANPNGLKPAADTGPLSRRWRKSTLDLYKFGSRGVVRTRQRKAA